MFIFKMQSSGEEGQVVCAGSPFCTELSKVRALIRDHLQLALEATKKEEK